MVDCSVCLLQGWRRYAEGLFHLGLYIEAWEVNREGQSHCACTAELKKQAITFQVSLFHQFCFHVNLEWPLMLD